MNYNNVTFGEGAKSIIRKHMKEVPSEISTLLHSRHAYDVNYARPVSTEVLFTCSTRRQLRIIPGDS